MYHVHYTLFIIHYILYTFHGIILELIYLNYIIIIYYTQFNIGI